MKFDVTAVIKEIGAVESVGAKGFQKRNLILSEESGQYENLVCVEFSGDKLATPETFTEGQTVTVSGFVNCREWNGKYFTSLRGSFINPAQQAAGDEYAQSYPPPEDMGQAPAYNQSQGYAQPVAPAQAPVYNQPQEYAQPPVYNQPQQYAQHSAPAPAPAPAPTYNAPQNNPYPQEPQSPNNGNVDTDIPF